MIKELSIKQARDILRAKGFVSTSTYTASVYYRKYNGTIWLSHPDYPRDRQYFNSLEEFVECNKDCTFYQQYRNYNPLFNGKYTVDKEGMNKGFRSPWSYPKYGSKLRERALKLL